MQAPTPALTVAVRLPRLPDRSVTPAGLPMGDVVLAGTLAAVAQAHVWLDGTLDGSRPGLAVQSLLVTGAVAWRRRAPLGAIGIAAVGVLLDFIVYERGQSDLILGQLLAGVALAYSVAAHEPRRDLSVAALLVLLTSFWLGDYQRATPADEYLMSAVTVSGTWLVGRLALRERTQTARLRSAYEELDRQRARAEAAAAEGARASPGSSMTWWPQPERDRRPSRCRGCPARAPARAGAAGHRERAPDRS